MKTRDCRLFYFIHANLLKSSVSYELLHDFRLALTPAFIASSKPLIISSISKFELLPNFSPSFYPSLFCISKGICSSARKLICWMFGKI